MIYDSEYDVNIKETCFGAIIEGEEDAIKSVVEGIRCLDPSGIFIKDRGFPLETPGAAEGMPPDLRAN